MLGGGTPFLPSLDTPLDLRLIETRSFGSGSRLPPLRDRVSDPQAGWPSRYPLLQPPNPPLWLALAGWAVALPTDGSVHAYARAAFYAGLAAWGLGELTSGVNLARRAMGAAALGYVIHRLSQVL